MHTAKKSLGQNFLKSEGDLRTIIGAAALHKGDIVLEVGPGHGALTQKLLETGAHVVAIEKDEALFAELHETFKEKLEKKSISLISGDILEFSPFEAVGVSPYVIVANIPYYITGQFIRKFLETNKQPSKMVLLVQKEVAERICARDGKESLLSISVKAYGNPSYIDTVKAGSFVPKPKVDSAIICIDAISRKNFENVNESRFFELLHRGFAHKRKLLRGNLGISAEILEKAGISPSARPENLSISDWLQLSKIV